jgi:hypothetical protein
VASLAALDNIGNIFHFISVFRKNIAFLDSWWKHIQAALECTLWAWNVYRHRFLN